MAEEKKKSRFDAKFLQAVLVRLILEPHFVIKFRKYLDASYFKHADEAGSLEVIAKIWFERVTGGASEPSFDSLYAWIQMQPDGELREKTIAALEHLRWDKELVAMAKTEHLFEVFLQWLKATAFLTEYREVKDAFNVGNYDRAYQSLEQTLGNIKSIALDSVESADWHTADKFLTTESLKMVNKFEFGIEDFDQAGGFEEQSLNLFVAMTNGGKCLGRDTPVLMFDGTVKMVQDVEIGDLLMGPDSTPRRVLNTCVGTGPLYKITPNKGMPWVCNDAHILSLRKTGTNEIVDIEIGKYLDQNNAFKHQHKQWRTGVEFPEKEVPFDPYTVGLWLGDGSCANAVIHNSSPAIHEYLERNGYLGKKVQEKTTWNLWITRPRCERQNPFVDTMRLCLDESGKRIPFVYLSNSRKIRSALLAGLLDTDGYTHHGNFEIITKFPGLKDDILFLARSLGLAAYASQKKGTIKAIGFEGTYWRVCLSGDMSFLPLLVKKPDARKRNYDVTNTGFKVEELGEGEYFGFVIDKDRRFLLGDFTVTHNTMLSVHLMAECVKQGKVGYFAFVEDRKTTILRRLYSNLTGIPINEMKNFASLPADKKAIVNEVTERLKKYLVVEFIYGVAPDFIFERTKEVMAQRRAAMLPQIEVMCVDYLQHIAQFSPGEKSHEKLANAMARYKDFVLKYKLTGFTHQQINRSGAIEQNKDNLITLGELSTSFNAAFVCDSILSLNRSPEQKEREEAVFYVLKGREGAAERRYQVKTNFACAQYLMSDYCRLDAMKS